MRRGEYDEFTDEDLRREFGKYGNVTRAEMTMDKETGWSKGTRRSTSPPLPYGYLPSRLGPPALFLHALRRTPNRPHPLAPHEPQADQRLLTPSHALLCGRLRLRELRDG